MPIKIAAAAATALTVLLVAAANAFAATTATTAVSSNWSGYAATGTAFSTVGGTWVQPAASCTSSTSATAASAFWVGLGGDSTASDALEQAGTEADCADGVARYSAWYELVPEASVKVKLAVSAGDAISASVRVDGTRVTVDLRNLTTKAVFSKTLTMASPDTSSAEWIAEAPSVVTPGGTQVLPLTDFGTVRFSKATATSAGGHTGTVSDSAWSTTRIRLESRGAGPGPYGQFAADQIGATEAVPTALSGGGGAFSVSWRRTSSSTPEPFA